MEQNSLLLILLVGVNCYLIYKVHSLERRLGSGGRLRRPTPAGDGKVVPILKEHIEPGPFRPVKGRQTPPDPDK